MSTVCPPQSMYQPRLVEVAGSLNTTTSQPSLSQWDLPEWLKSKGRVNQPSFPEGWVVLETNTWISSTPKPLRILKPGMVDAAIVYEFLCEYGYRAWRRSFYLLFWGDGVIIRPVRISASASMFSIRRDVVYGYRRLNKYRSWNCGTLRKRMLDELVLVSEPRLFINPVKILRRISGGFMVCGCES